LRWLHHPSVEFGIPRKLSTISDLQAGRFVKDGVARHGVLKKPGHDKATANNIERKCRGEQRTEGSLSLPPVEREFFTVAKWSSNEKFGAAR
jgi:hypothetical protein